MGFRWGCGAGAGSFWGPTEGRRRGATPWQWTNRTARRRGIGFCGTWSLWRPWRSWWMSFCVRTTTSFLLLLRMMYYRWIRSRRRRCRFSRSGRRRLDGTPSCCWCRYVCFRGLTFGFLRFWGEISCVDFVWSNFFFLTDSRDNLC